MIGGVILEKTGNVTMLYGVIGLLVFLLAVGFAFTPVGHARRYLPDLETKESLEQEAKGFPEQEASEPLEQLELEKGGA
jgi:hypothetical protein